MKILGFPIHCISDCVTQYVPFISPLNIYIYILIFNNMYIIYIYTYICISYMQNVCTLLQPDDIKLLDFSPHTHSIPFFFGFLIGFPIFLHRLASPRLTVVKCFVWSAGSDGLIKDLMGFDVDWIIPLDGDWIIKHDHWITIDLM